LTKNFIEITVLLKKGLVIEDILIWVNSFKVSTPNEILKREKFF